MATVMLFSLMTFTDVTGTQAENGLVVTAQAATKKIGLKNTKVTLTTGATNTLKLLDKKGKTISASKVKWSTSSKKIATVSKKGVIKGVKKGTAKITATYKGKKYTCKVTVKNATISATKKTLAVGKSFTLSLKDATGKKIAAKDVAWSTSNKAIATVSAKGAVKAVKKGSATITATYKGKKYTCKVTSVRTGLEFNSVTLYIGETAKQTLYNSKGKKVSDARWGTENYSVANISYNGDGTITPKAAGKAKLYAQYDGKKYYFTVTVKEPSIKLDKTSATIKEGTTLKLTATTTPANKAVTWSTSDKNIATVSSSGVVTPLRAGTCEIIAKYKYGSYSYNYVEAKCKVTCTFEGSDFRTPVSGQSGKTVIYQEFSSRPQFKVKVKFTKLIRGEQANTIVYNENKYNDKPSAGYEWCLIYADITHVSNTKGSNTVLEAVDILYTDTIYTSNGSSVAVQDMATFSGSLKGMGVYDVEMYPGATGSVVLGVLIPSNSGDLLLKVPNLSSNTWVKIDAPSAPGGNGSGGNQGGSTTPDNPAMTPAENFSYLKQYIRTYGTTNKTGETKYIQNEYTKDGYTYTGTITYNLSTTKLWFQLTSSYRGTVIGDIGFETTDITSPFKLNAMIWDISTSGMYLGSSTGNAFVSATDYICPSNVTFTWTNVYDFSMPSASYDPYASLTGANGNMKASALYDVAVALWDVMIFNKTGLSMTDIGFGA